MIVLAPTSSASYRTTTLPSSSFASTLETPGIRPMDISMRGGHDAHTIPPTLNANPLVSITSAAYP